MTRKHFNALAEALAQARRQSETGATAPELLDALEQAVADVCAATNPDFNRQRFLLAAS